MKTEEFDMTAIDLFGGILEPLGFSAKGTRFCTFHRKVNAEIYHVVMPDIASRGVWYDVKVAVVSPLLDPEFHTKFPDSIGLHCCRFLNRWDGVSARQQQFNCKYAENMSSVFRREVSPLLLEKGIPFLDRIATLKDLLPFLVNPVNRGLALYHLGERDAAREILRTELARLWKVVEAHVMAIHIQALLDQSSAKTPPSHN